MYDIIVVGGGPAGMTAALYALRNGKRVLVLEKNGFGGQIAYSPKVENYPGSLQLSGSELAEKMLDQVLAHGAEVALGQATAIRRENDCFGVLTEDGEYLARSVILATGSHHRLLGIDREEEFIGNGISFCAVCDGAFYKGKDVLVVGGGNTALQDALLLSSYCRKVYLVHRRSAFRGEQKSAEALKAKENVSFILDSVITKIGGEDSVSFAEIENVKTKEKSTVSVSGVFVAVGQKPDNEAFKSVADLDEYGFIIAGEDCRTKTDGIFAAGDCRTKAVRQLTTAAADGAVAALGACEFAE